MKKIVVLTAVAVAVVAVAIVVGVRVFGSVNWYARGAAYASQRGRTGVPAEVRDPIVRGTTRQQDVQYFCSDGLGSAPTAPQPPSADLELGAQAKYDKWETTSAAVKGWFAGCESVAARYLPRLTASGNYTYQEGENAAMQVTYADLGGTGSTADANWCSSKDPSPGASEDGVTASGGFGSSKGTQWYEGCMALLRTDPPSPAATATPTPTTQQPGYQFGYQEGLQGASEVGTNGQFTTGKEWCEGDGTLSNTISDNNWNPTQVVAGCVAAMKAKGVPGS